MKKIAGILRSKTFFWVSAIFPFVWLVGGLLILKNFSLPPFLEYFNSNPNGKLIFATVWALSIIFHLVTRIPGFIEYMRKHFEASDRLMIVSCAILGFVLYCGLYLVMFLAFLQLAASLNYVAS